MTQPIAHCPFCLEEFDLVCDTNIESFGNMDMVTIECPEHGNIIIIAEDIYKNACGGSMLADCPKCDETVFLTEMNITLRGSG